MRILCTGDVHIGRRSTRLPAHFDGHANSCASAWNRIVEQAIRERVDLVCLAGDLIDQSNRYLEALGPVERGLERLAAAGIETLLVAGNHDHDVLPTLVEGIRSPRVRLLGRGGRWQRVSLDLGGDALHVDGWSFPQSHYLSSPLRDYQPSVDEAPILGLLHADLDERGGGRYAPISIGEMRRFPETFFVLGHVHAPRLYEEPGGARFLYPGSPQSIDRSETGHHGIVLLERSGGRWSARPIPLSTVRYEPLELDVEGIADASEVDVRLGQVVREALTEVAEDAEHLRCVRFRVKLTGRSRVARAIEARVTELADDLELSHGEVTGSVESVWSAMGPAHDLEALARGIGAPAVLARILAGEGVDDRLKVQLRRLVEEVHGSRSFAEVSGGHEDLETLGREAEAELGRAATILLDELLAARSAK